MRDIFNSPQSYRHYLKDQTILDLEGILRKIDGETYPDRKKLVEEVLERKRKEDNFSERVTFMDRLRKKLRLKPVKDHKPSQL